MNTYFSSFAAISAIFVLSCSSSSAEVLAADAGSAHVYGDNVVVLSGTYKGTYEPDLPWSWSTPSCAYQPKAKIAFELYVEKDALINVALGRAMTAIGAEPSLTMEGLFGESRTAAEMAQSPTCIAQPEFAFSAYTKLLADTSGGGSFNLSSEIQQVTFAERTAGLKDSLFVTIFLGGSQFESSNITKVKIVGQTAEMFDIRFTATSSKLTHANGMVTMIRTTK